MQPGRISFAGRRGGALRRVAGLMAACILLASAPSGARTLTTVAGRTFAADERIPAGWVGEPGYDRALDLDTDGRIGFGDYLRLRRRLGDAGAAEGAAGSESGD